LSTSNSHHTSRNCLCASTCPRLRTNRRRKLKRIACRRVGREGRERGGRGRSGGGDGVRGSNDMHADELIPGRIPCGQGISTHLNILVLDNTLDPPLWSIVPNQNSLSRALSLSPPPRYGVSFLINSPSLSVSRAHAQNGCEILHVLSLTHAMFIEEREREQRGKREKRGAKKNNCRVWGLIYN